MAYFNGKKIPTIINTIADGKEEITEVINPIARGKTVVPPSGKVFSSVLVTGDSKLKPENVKMGVKIFDVEGEYMGEGTPITLTPTAEGFIVHPTITLEGVVNYSDITVEGDENLIPENIKEGVTIFDVEGTLSSSEKPEQSKTVTPTASGLTVVPDSGKALSSVVVNGDADLVAENIKEGVTIFDVVGTFAGGGESRAKVFPITLASNVTAPQMPIVINDADIAQHYADDSLVCTFIPLFNDTTYHSVRGVTVTNQMRSNSFYGAAWYCSSSEDSFSNIEHAFKDFATSESPTLASTSNGTIFIKASNSRFFGAGNWLLVVAW